MSGHCPDCGNTMCICTEITAAEEAERDRLTRVVDALHDAEVALAAVEKALAAVSQPDETYDSITDIMWHTNSVLARVRREANYLGRSL